MAGQKEKLGKQHSVEDNDEEDDHSHWFPQRITAYLLVMKFQWTTESIRLELVGSSENYLNVSNSLNVQDGKLDK